MAKTADTLKRDAELRQKMSQGLAAFDDYASGADVNSAPCVFLSRHDAPAPHADVHDIYNPDGIVDIVTFCEHPHFLDLRLTPWQKIIVKSFYMGTEGNTHLKIDAESVETGCAGCVWEHVMDAEVEQARQGKTKLPIMLPPNSPCLTCNRLPPDVHGKRYDQLYAKALNDKAKASIKNLQDRLITDRYMTEWGALHDKQVKDEVRDQIKEKLGNKFQELILVLGRRSGKSFMVSIIALYEVYRFLMMIHPQPRFSMLDYDTITICNVANSEGQAKSAIFDKIAQLVLSSPFFGKYVGKKTLSELHFCTPQDAKENERRAANGDDPMTGTIQLISGHSNSKTLVGRSMAVIILDEMAEMAGKNEDATDADLYTKLKPSIATFGLEGKIICISNPLGPFGKFFNLYESSFGDDTTLMFQLPTWLSNPNVSNVLLESERRKDPASFSMHYGAEFGDAGASPFIPSENIKNAFLRGEGRRRGEFGEPNVRYFGHLDPAYSSDNYTLVVVHTEPMFGVMEPDGKPTMRVVVDHIMIWKPRGPNHPINVEEVDAYVMALAGKFKFTQLSYDHWNSQGSIIKLRSHGLPVICTPFTRDYQDKIFQIMFDLFTGERIDFYNINSTISNERGNESLDDVKEAKDQLLMLQRVFRANRYKIEAIPGKHDDICDCVASAGYQALKDKVYSVLPRARAAMLASRFQ